MTIDNQTDVPVTAVAALARGAVQSDLGADVLLGVYSDPRDLFNIPDEKLPALCIHRVSDSRRRRNSSELVWDVVIGFEYMLPSSSFDERTARFPALQAIWASISNAVIAGHHDAVSDDDAVLELAGTWALEETVRAKYQMADGGRETFPDKQSRHPVMLGEITVTYVETGVSVDDFEDYLTHYTAYDLVESVDTAIEAEDLTTMPT